MGGDEGWMERKETLIPGASETFPVQFNMLHHLVLICCFLHENVGFYIKLWCAGWTGWSGAELRRDGGAVKPWMCSYKHLIVVEAVPLMWRLLRDIIPNPVWLWVANLLACEWVCDVISPIVPAAKWARNETPSIWTLRRDGEEQITANLWVKLFILSFKLGSSCCLSCDPVRRQVESDHVLCRTEFWPWHRRPGAVCSESCREASKLPLKERLPQQGQASALFKMSPIRWGHRPSLIGRERVSVRRRAWANVARP